MNGMNVTTRLYVPKGRGPLTRHPDGPEVHVVFTIDLLPRGSGNRNRARRLAESFRRNRDLQPHLVKVIAGTSRVTVRMRATFDAWEAVQRIREDSRRDVPGQLTLPLLA